MTSSQQSGKPLTQAERRIADGLGVWTVWYEDRFGWGPERDPASPLAVFLTAAEADAYIRANGGEHDIEVGKFDGLFRSGPNPLGWAVDRAHCSIDRARELLAAVS